MIDDDDDHEEDRLKPQTDSSRSSGGSRYPPRKTALGTHDGGGPNYARGDKLKCRVIGFRPGGFEILIVDDDITGFLKSEEHRNLGDEFFAQFEGWQERRRS